MLIIMKIQINFKTIIVGIIFTFSLFFNIYIAFQTISQEKNYLVMLNKQNEEIQQIKNSCKNIKDIYLSNWSIKQRNVIALENIRLMNLLKTGDKIACYIRKDMCNSCILQVLQDLLIVEEKIGTKKVVLLVDKKAKEKASNFENYRFDVIFLDTLHLPIEDSLKSPLVFILNKDLDIILPYSIDWYPKLYQKYFEEILLLNFKR